MIDNKELKKEIYTKLGWSIKYAPEAIPADDEGEYDTLDLPYLVDDTGAKKTDAFLTEEDLWENAPLIGRWLVESFFRNEKSSGVRGIEMDYKNVDSKLLVSAHINYGTDQVVSSRASQHSDAMHIAVCILDFLKLRD